MGTVVQRRSSYWWDDSVCGFGPICLLGSYTASSCGTRGLGRPADPGRGGRMRQQGPPALSPRESATV